MVTTLQGLCRDGQSEEESTARDDVLERCDRLGFYTSTFFFPTGLNHLIPPTWRVGIRPHLLLQTPLPEDYDERGGPVHFHFYSFSRVCSKIVWLRVL